MPNVWVSAAALTAALAAVGVVLFDRGVSMSALAWTAAAGLAATAMAVRAAWSGSARLQRSVIVQVRKEDLQVKNSSIYWIGTVCLAAAAAAFYGILAAEGFALRGLAWITLGLSAVTMVVVARKTPRSLGDVLDDVDHEGARPAVQSSDAASQRREGGTL